MRILQSHSFEKAMKRLHDNQKEFVDKAVETICANPSVGELKIGDLAGFRVYKFRVHKQLVLLAYSYDETAKTLMLELFGPHENFYRELKK